jgi:chemotaxis protein methyltransferase CheR
VTAFDGADLERLRTLLRGRLGLQLEAGTRDGLAEALAERMRESGCDRFATYWPRLASAATASAELRALVERVTVGETYFFRNQDQLAAFVEVALPDRARARATRRTLRLLSAGCASGEEAYTLAILVSEHLPDRASWDVRITGVDINVASLEKARRARYSSWSLRQSPPAMHERYFRADGRELALDERIRGMVVFEERNLLDDDPAFLGPGSFDVIFFRNVSIYLTPEATRRVVAKLAAALAPDGFLFLGDAETLRNVSREFHLRNTHRAFYYQRRDDVELRPFEPDRDHDGGPQLRAPEPDSAWIDAIRRASERIAVLEESPPLLPAGVALPRRTWDLGPAIELVRRERFTEALAALRELPADADADPEAQLLRAAILTNRGDAAEAEAVCAAVLARDELNAEAHYLKALCRERAGDRAGAAEHDRAAAYLDPTFAMPHLHLGLLARRAGDGEGTRAMIGRALELLEREAASRILLFGGGFNREALLRLCRSELGLESGAP